MIFIFIFPAPRARKAGETADYPGQGLVRRRLKVVVGFVRLFSLDGVHHKDSIVHIIVFVKT